MSKYQRYTLWLVSLLFLLRLFHITYPPVEAAHNWRQATTLMVARNFCTDGPDVMHPKVDDRGSGTGITAMEFPFLALSIWSVSRPFGYDHWYGRLVNLLIVSIATWVFFLLVRLYYNDRLSFYATVAFALSSIFHLARKVLPDPMALSLVIIGLYGGVIFLRRGNWTFLIVFLLAGCLGTLVKIPYGVYLSLLIFPFIDSKIPVYKKAAFVITSLTILLTVGWYYFIWNVHLSETYGQWYNSGRPLFQGAAELLEAPGDVGRRFLFNAFHSYLFGIAAITALVFAIYSKARALLWPILLLSPLFVVYMMRSGFLFYHHGYYVLVMVPVMALLIAFLLDKIPVRWAAFILLAGGIESVANQQNDFFVPPAELAKTGLSELADAVSSKSDLIALEGSSGNPNEFYFLDRKGWIIPGERLDSDGLAELREQGCRFLFINRNRSNLTPDLRLIRESHGFAVYAF